MPTSLLADFLQDTSIFTVQIIQVLFKTFGQFPRTFQDKFCFQGLQDGPSFSDTFQAFANPSKSMETNA